MGTRPAIRIDPQVPTWASLSVVQAIDNIIVSTCRHVGARSLQETIEALEAQVYFAACKQLTMLMDPYELSRLGPLAALATRTISIPQSVAAALAAMLSLDTFAGPVHIKHISLLFRRWLVTGLARFPRSPYRKEAESVLIWGDAESKQWLDETLRPFCLAEDMLGEECRRLRQCVYAPLRHPVYEVFGVEMARHEHEPGVLLEMFEKYNRVYEDTYGMIVSAVMGCVYACEGDQGAIAYSRV